MGLIDYITVAIVGLGIIFSIRSVIKRKKTNPCGGCSGCPQANQCKSKQ